MSRILSDSWFKEVDDAGVDLNNYMEALKTEVAHAFRRSEKKNKMRNAFFREVCAKQNLASFVELNQLFEKMDHDHDGKLSRDEVQKTLEGQQWKAEEIESFLELAKNEKDEISYEGFMATMISAQETEEEALTERLFAEADEDHSGYLSKDELSKLLKRPLVVKIMGNTPAAQVLKDMDTDGDGQISLEEFKAVLCPQTTKPGPPKEPPPSKTGPKPPGPPR
jgi:Ca2+-binding EF-hand superfamily protein